MRNHGIFVCLTLQPFSSNAIEYLDLSSTQLTGDMLPAEYTSTSLGKILILVWTTYWHLFLISCLSSFHVIVTMDLSSNNLGVEVDISAISGLLNLGRFFFFSLI